MSKEFDNILDECLERLLAKGETVEQCLQSYPGQAAKLKPLLEVALVAKEASAIQPRPEFKARARYQFHSALQEMVSQRSRPLFGWFPRWATVIAVFAAVLLVGGSTVTAASYSMPDDPLYPMKLATERVQLMLPLSDVDKASLCARLADRRVAEIIYMASKGDAQQVEVITQRLDESLDLLARLVSASKEDEALMTLAPSARPAPAEEAAGAEDASVEENGQTELKTVVESRAIYAPDALRIALEKAPESARPALRQSIAVSVAGYNKALNALD